MSVNPTESNDLEVDIVLPNFDINVFEKEADEDRALIIAEKKILAKKLTTSCKAKNQKRQSKKLN